MPIDGDRELRKSEIQEKVYQEFLKAVGDVPESEWQYLALACSMRLVEGVEISIRAKLMSRDLGEQLKFSVRPE